MCLRTAGAIARAMTPDGPIEPEGMALLPEVLLDGLKIGGQCVHAMGGRLGLSGGVTEPFVPDGGDDRGCDVVSPDVRRQRSQLETAMAA